jgi:hypothetical protein
METKLEEKIFLICPVREISDDENKFLQGYVSKLESKGCKVHYPLTKTNQNDPIGLNICSENRDAIKKSNIIHIYYNPKSTGSIFDFGMTFMTLKPLHIINLNKPPLVHPDDFATFLIEYSNSVPSPSGFYKNKLKRIDEIRDSDFIEYEWNGNTRDFLFDFGMVFMAGKPIKLINRDKVERTPYKSFQNVLLALDEIYRKRGLDAL